MKTLFSKISILAFLLAPFLLRADAPGGGVHVETAFKITNVKDFGEYNFYYIHWGDSVGIKQGKTYSFTHRGNPEIGWGIYIYAQNKDSKKITVPLDINTNESKEIITITGIYNDSIRYTSESESYRGETGETTSPGDNSSPGDENLPTGPVVSGTSAMTYLLIGISATAMLIFGIVIYMRTKKSVQVK